MTNQIFITKYNKNFNYKDIILTLRDKLEIEIRDYVVPREQNIIEKLRQEFVSYDVKFQLENDESIICAIDVLKTDIPEFEKLIQERDIDLLNDIVDWEYADDTKLKSSDERYTELLN